MQVQRGEEGNENILSTFSCPPPLLAYKVSMREGERE